MPCRLPEHNQKQDVKQNIAKLDRDIGDSKRRLAELKRQIGQQHRPRSVLGEGVDHQGPAVHQMQSRAYIGHVVEGVGRQREIEAQHHRSDGRQRQCQLFNAQERSRILAIEATLHEQKAGTNHHRKGGEQCGERYLRRAGEAACHGREKNAEQAVEIPALWLDAEESDDSGGEGVGQRYRLHRPRAETCDSCFHALQMRDLSVLQCKCHEKRKMHDQGSLHRPWSIALPELQSSVFPGRNADNGDRQQDQNGAPDIDTFENTTCRLAATGTDPILDCGTRDRQLGKAGNEKHEIAEPRFEPERADEHDQPEKSEYGERCHRDQWSDIGRPRARVR